MRRDERQFEREGGAGAGPFTVRGQGTAHFLGGESAAVQTEAVTIFLGGKAVREDARQIVWRDADAVVFDDDGNAFVVVHADGDFNALVSAGGGVDGVFRVTDQVHENLENLVFIDRDEGHFLVIAGDDNAVTGKSGGIHLQGVFHEALDGERFDDAGNARVILLHRDNFLNQTAG